MNLTANRLTAAAGLGVSLWRDQRRHAGTVDAPATVRVAEPVTG